MRTLFVCLLCANLAVPAVSRAVEQAPQAVPDSERREGESLSDRLDRTDGVIKPPPVGAPMHVAPPPDTSNMPVIKPQEAPPQQSGPDAAGK